MTRAWVRRPMAMLAVVALVLGALALSIAGPSGGAESLEKELVIVATGGAFEQALKEHFYEPFSRATGVTVRAVAASKSEQWAKARAMSQTGQIEWDIVTSHEDVLLSHRDLLARLDCTAIPNAAAQGVPGTCREYSVLRTIGGSVLAYDTRVFPTGKHPRSWAEFWDVKRFPGPRSLPSYGAPEDVLMLALMADGVPGDKLFPLDVDRAFRKLDEIKPHIKVWWKTGDQSQQIMRDGEVVLAWLWDGRATALKAAGAPVGLEWNQGIRGPVSWSVLKGAPHPKAAMAFLNFFLDRPEAHLAFSRKLFYDTPNRKALELLPEPERPARATFPANWNAMVDIDHAWVAANKPRLLDRWNAWIAR